jgi:DNA-binding response OmpR family regulator
MAETILVVDDDPDIARFVEVNLRSAGYDVSVAGDGEEALERATEMRPDLVLLDVMMPQVDGWEMLRQLQERQGEAIPVVMFSGQADAATPDEIAERGATGFIGKPFDPSELIEKTKQLLSS